MCFSDIFPVCRDIKDRRCSIRLSFCFYGKITNDYEKYKKDAEPLLISMTLLIAVTGILVLAMDYPSTKRMLNSFIIGIAIAVVSGWFAHRKSVAGKTENL